MERMTASQERPGQAQRGKTLFPFLVLGIGVALSLLLHFVIRDNVKGEAQLRFERQASDAQHVIEARIKSYADVLHGLGALSNTSNSVPRAASRCPARASGVCTRYRRLHRSTCAAYVPNAA